MANSIEFITPFNFSKTEKLIHQYFKLNNYYLLQGKGLSFKRAINISPFLNPKRFGSKVEIELESQKEDYTKVKIAFKVGSFWNPLLPLDKIFYAAEMTHLKNAILNDRIVKFDTLPFENKSKQASFLFWIYFILICLLFLWASTVLDNLFVSSLGVLIGGLGAWLLVKLQTKGIALSI